MFISEKKHFTFEFNQIVGNDINGPVVIQPEKISYTYNVKDKSVQITGWSIFSHTLKVWISIPVEDLLNNPVNYLKIVELARIDYHARNPEPLSEETESFLFKHFFKKAQG